VPDLVSQRLRTELEKAELCRVRLQRCKDPFDCDQLIKWLMGHPGPRLVIMNTVQSAAVLADRMRGKCLDVVHLSTALAPVHRELMVKRVNERLRHGVPDWTLVATSCVEAGMDFSFRTGFRESCSTASLIQTSGRVSRGAEHKDAAVWDFRTLDDLVPNHRGFEVSRRVLDGLINAGQFQMISAGELAKEAMRREVTAADESRAREILEAEKGMEYPCVDRLCRVIQADTRIVLVDREIAEALQRGDRVNPIRVMRRSVQLWASRVQSLRLKPLFDYAQGDTGLYVWTALYDPDFLGYMAGVLPLVYGKQEGLILY
jgi:CRISPR-associated endonuclease/helicase Cas3